MKILDKLTLKNLRLNKSRTIVTIIGIILSTALLTVVAGSASSLQQSIINAQIRLSGDYDINVYKVTNENAESFKNHRDIGAVYIRDYLGCAYMPEAKSEEAPYISLVAFSQNAPEDEYGVTLQEGRLPENSKELALTQSFLKSTNHEFKVGDTLTLEVGRRYDKYGAKMHDQSEYGAVFYNGEYISEEDDGDKTETFKPERTETYTIVGILNECHSANVEGMSYYAGANAITMYEGAPLSEFATADLDILPDREKDYLKIAGELSGLTEKEVRIYIGMDDGSESEQNRIYEKTKIQFSFNSYLLQLKGYGNSDDTTKTIYALTAVILAIIIIASVFVIRNSFAISITEKTKLYGMMSSIGATSKQIRQNVLFEGFVLGAVGIPLGLLLGVGVTALLLIIINILLAEPLEGIKIVYSIPPLIIFLSVALSALTIFFSTLSSAIRASKITPVEAIRATNDVKIKNNKKIKAPKWVKKFFGAGGDIAYKNLKRSRKKYRTSVISITVSVMLFVAISSFVEMGNRYVSMYYTEMNYNISVNEYINYTDSEEVDEMKKDFDSIRKMDGVVYSYITMLSWDGFTVDKDMLENEALLSENSVCTGSDGNDSYLNIKAVGLEDSAYREAVKQLGFNYDKAKDKGILCNEFSYRNDGKICYDNILNRDGGFTLESIVFDDENRKPVNLEITGSVKALEIPDGLKNLGFDEGTVLVHEDVFNNMFANSQYILNIYSEDADKLQEDLEKAGYDYSIYNYDENMRNINAVILVFSIFIYGFIIVITLIGVTNIFNTITTNMRLRSTEFAMLKSIGMTKKEFDRMVRLESLFYGAKSLLIGIPLGILGSLGIFCAFTNKIEYDYTVPWTAILISIVFVFVIVWMIMRFSVAKVRKQNIIEAIRNDNI